MSFVLFLHLYARILDLYVWLLCFHAISGKLEALLNLSADSVLCWTYCQITIQYLERHGLVCLF